MEENKSENININVEKRKKKNFIPFVLIIIILIIGIVGIIVSDRRDDGQLNGSVIEEEKNNTVTSDTIPNETTQDTEKKEDERKPEISKEAEAVYDKYKDAVWVSSGIVEKLKLFEIKEGKIYYTNGEMKDKLVPFNYGTPKYLKLVIGGGVPQYISVITGDGKVWLIKIPDTFLGDEDFDFENGFEYEQIKFEEKVIDMMINNRNVIFPYSGPYYLTESGKLVNKDKKTYEEINRNHMLSVGTIYVPMFINEDLTIEVLRSYEAGEYISVLNSKGDKVKAKYLMQESSTRWTGTTSDHYFVVDENDKLLHFADNTLYVANEYFDAKDKKVSKIEYDEKNSKVKVSFEDGTSLTLNDICYHINVSNYDK